MEVPRSRTYLHSKCGQGTTVSGDNFAYLSDPFLFCWGTYCAHCKTYRGLGAFVWADTGESLAARRRRLRRGCPRGVKVWGWFLGPLLVAAAGAVVGWLAIGRPPEGPIAGACIGWLPAVGVLPSLLAKHVWGIEFRALL